VVVVGTNYQPPTTNHQPLTNIYGIGWKSKSGKKRLNSINSPAVNINKANSNTGAKDIYLRKLFCCMNYAPLDLGVLNERILHFEFEISDLFRLTTGFGIKNFQLRM
jgi:hypothetical protein